MYRLCPDPGRYCSTFCPLRPDEWHGASLQARSGPGAQHCPLQSPVCQDWVLGPETAPSHFLHATVGSQGSGSAPPTPCMSRLGHRGPTLPSPAPPHAGIGPRGPGTARIQLCVLGSGTRSIVQGPELSMHLEIWQMGGSATKFPDLWRSPRIG